jgi:hypothetical protein
MVLREFLKTVKGISKAVILRENTLILLLENANVYINNIDFIKVTNHFIVDTKYFYDILVHLPDQIEILEEAEKMFVKVNDQEIIIGANITEVIAHSDIAEKLLSVDTIFLKAIDKKLNYIDGNLYFYGEEKRLVKLSKQTGATFFSKKFEGSDCVISEIFLKFIGLRKTFDSMNVNVFATNQGYIYADDKFNVVFDFAIAKDTLEFIKNNTLNIVNQNYNDMLEIGKVFNRYINLDSLLIYNINKKTYIISKMMSILGEWKTNLEKEIFLFVKPKDFINILGKDNIIFLNENEEATIIKTSNQNMNIYYAPIKLKGDFKDKIRNLIK